jgi:environmental stress-induced protein Ves
VRAASRRARHLDRNAWAAALQWVDTGWLQCSLKNVRFRAHPTPQAALTVASGGSAQRVLWNFRATKAWPDRHSRMTPRLIAAASQRRMPWKNGGGETFEVALHPEDAGLDRFDWRISMARITRDGVFSAFPAVDRTICILAGRGLELEMDGRAPVILSDASPPLAFPGDVQTRGSLHGEPILDLNVMTRRGAFSHKVERLELVGPIDLETEEGWTFVVCGRGQLAEKRSGMSLSENDTLAVDAATTLRLVPAGDPATAFLVRIRQVKTA